MRQKISVILIASAAILSVYCFTLIVFDAFFVAEQSNTNEELLQANEITYFATRHVGPSDRIQNVSEGNRRMRTNILFLKTHKTGSSTLQNVLMRFVLRHSLSLMLPATGNYIGYFGPLNAGSISKRLMPVEGKFNVFACHSRYHQNTLKFMHNDTIRITLLRYPADTFESLFGFFRLDKYFNTTLEGLVRSLPNTSVNFTRRGIRSKSTNQMCYDLGLVVENKTDDTMIGNFIHYVDREFDFVMITEYFDACLILLADLMRWPLKYVTYFTILARVSARKSTLTAEEKVKLLELNGADSSLYFYFVDKLRKRMLQYGVDRLIGDLRMLRKLNDELYAKCISAETNKGFWGTVGYALKPDPDWECVYATKAELQFINEVREKQIRRFAEEKKIVDLCDERL